MDIILEQCMLRTRDILRVLNNSSLSEIEKLLVCCPICMLSPSPGAYMSLVIARICPQLSISALAASVEA